MLKSSKPEEQTDLKQQGIARSLTSNLGAQVTVQSTSPVVHDTVILDFEAED